MLGRQMGAPGLDLYILIHVHMPSHGSDGISGGITRECRLVELQNGRDGVPDLYIIDPCFRDRRSQDCNRYRPSIDLLPRITEILRHTSEHDIFSPLHTKVSWQPMSTAAPVSNPAVDKNGSTSPTPARAPPQSPASEGKPQSAPANYKGFVAGIFSGFAKLSVGHPFDTIKVRLQTSSKSKFKGPLDCVLQTVRKEGVRGLYKGATPPLVGWMFMDSLYVERHRKLLHQCLQGTDDNDRLMGSLTVYRRLLRERIFAPKLPSGLPDPNYKLPPFGHGIAGLGAGCTVSLIAAPVEHVKARLQVQYSAKKSERPYSGPIDCTTKILKNYGVRGLFRGLLATMLFRSWFFVWWSTYDIFSRLMREKTKMSTPAINFWAGGLSAQCFWLTSYPADVVKQRIMTDGLGEDRKFRRWTDAAAAVGREAGWRGYWRGFVPCFLRAFPANACALVAFEAVMRVLE